MKTLGFLVERDGRTLFLREMVEWAIEDSAYKVIELASKTDLLACEESRQLLMEIYLIQEEEILLLKNRLKELEK